MRIILWKDEVWHAEHPELHITAEGQTIEEVKESIIHKIQAWVTLELTGCKTIWVIDETKNRADVMEEDIESQRKYVEQQVEEAVAMIFNYEFNQLKSWEECYRELAIKQAIKHNRLWIKFVELEQQLLKNQVPLKGEVKA